ncbi:MAG: fructose-2,6-bisphosphatase [Acidimicrobiia bacterium]|nr:fructose-2,6-bisphosphatase [Acidimicrobiia bacterium]
MPPPTQVLLIRHGQSTWNAEGRWQGDADPPLSGEGISQARDAAAHLGTFDAVFTSDLQRARHTADLLSGELGIGPVIVEPLLRERAAGEWTGLTRVEIEAGWPGALAGHERPPGYEPDAEVFGRAMAALALAHRVTPGGLVLAVSHGGLIRSLERELGDDGGLLPNLGGRWAYITDERVSLGERVRLIDPAPLPAPEAL